MPQRILRAVYVGDTSDLEAANRRAASSTAAAGDDINTALDRSTAGYAKLAAASQESSDKLVLNVRNVAKAAVESAAQMGVSVDEQVAQAAKAAGAWTDASARMSSAQKAAGQAAIRAAQEVGASVDEQAAAYQRAIEAQGELEASAREAAAVQADASAKASAAAKAAADEQVAAAARIKAANDDVSAKMGAASESLLSKVGKFSAIGAVATAAGTAYEGVKGFVSLQSQLEKLHTQAGASTAQVKQMQAAVLSLGGQTAEGPNALAQALYHIESSGYRSGHALDILKTAAAGAQTGGADLTDVTNALTASIVSGISGVHSYGQAMGALNAIVGSGDMSMQDLTDALSGTGLLSVAKTAGVSLRDVGAALATFGDNGIRGSAAATKLRQAIVTMAAPSDTAAEWLHLIGINANELGQDMQSGGLMKALEDLKGKLEQFGASKSQTEEILAKAFGGGRTSTAVQLLLSQLDRVKNKFADVGKGAHDFGSDYAATQQTLSYKFDELKSEVSDLADKFGAVLVPALSAVTGAIESSIQWLDRHKQAAILLADVIGSVLGAALIVFATNRVQEFVGGLQKMRVDMVTTSGESGSMALAIGQKLGLINVDTGKTAAITQASADEMVAADAQMSAGVTSVGVATTETAGVVSTGVGEMATASTIAAGEIKLALGSTGIGLVIVGLGVAITELAEHWHSALKGMESIAESFAHVISGVFDGVSNSIANVGNSLGQGIGNLTSASSLSPAMQKRLMLNISPQQEINQLGSVAPAKGSYTSTTFAIAALEQLGITPTAQNVADFTAWEAQEGGNWDNNAKYNPLDTTMKEPGSTGVGTQGNIGSYTSWAEGLKATVDTLKNYSGILAALKASDSLSGFSNAVNNTTENGTSYHWGTGAINAQGVHLSQKQLTNLEKSLGYSTTQAGSINDGLTKSQQELQNLIDKLEAGNKTASDTYTKTAAATSTIPVAAVTMLSTALALIGTKYVRGGGHGSTFDPISVLKQIGVDCSGFVSAVLHSGGVSMPGPLTTGGLPSVLQKGQGKYVTVYDRANAGMNSHTIIDILGKWFESGGSPQFNPSGGVSELSQKQAQGELSGGGFAAYHPILGGKDATDKYLAQYGLSASSAAASSGVSLAQLVAEYIQAEEKTFTTQADALLTRYANDSQSSTTPRALESALGVSTTAVVGSRSSVAYKDAEKRYRAVLRNPNATMAQRYAAHEQLAAAAPQAASSAIYDQIESLKPGSSISQIEGALTPTLSAASAGSVQEKQFNLLISELKATGKASMEKLAGSLVAAHKQAMQTLALQMYAKQATADANSLNLQATQLKDQTQLISDSAAAQLQVAKDQEQSVVDAMQSQVTAIKDASQVITDTMSAVSQAISDTTQSMADASNAVVQGINDQTQTQVDTLAERGLYGLALVAQQLQVQEDQTKTYYDQQIALAQQQVDLATQVANVNVSNAQSALDQTQLQQDALVSAAQQNADTVLVAQDSKIAAAQAHVDAVALAQDVLVQTAQNTVNSDSNAPAATQQAAQAILAKAQAAQTLANNSASATLATVTDNANAAIQASQTALQNAQGQAATLEATAQATLAAAQSQAATQIGLAQQGLQSIQDTAAQAEAILQGQINVTQEESSTQYAGSGLVVNMYGLNSSDATGNAAALGWQLRTLIPA